MEESRQRLAEAELIAAGDEQLLRLVLIAAAELATRQGDNKRALDLLVELETMAHATSDGQEQTELPCSSRYRVPGSATDRPRWLISRRRRNFSRTIAPPKWTGRECALSSTTTHELSNPPQITSQRRSDMGRELGLTHVVMVNLCHLGEVLVRLGDLSRAYGTIRQSLALSEERGDERFANRNAMLLAFLDGFKDDGDSEQRIRSGIDYANRRGFTNDVIRGKLLLAQGLARRNGIAAARAEYETTYSMALEAGQRLLADDSGEAALTALPADNSTELVLKEMPSS